MKGSTYQFGIHLNENESTIWLINFTKEACH